ncbi:LuxR C-terminal-related transcriptional regulator [Nonomuraea sp. NPDC050556]|uniref:helix-turn-helix transcriptional regulator n=1 Tax=Nonomuraea sp. NPDC050556 TaxID=3364369 RepID=UPI0037BC01D7
MEQDGLTDVAGRLRSITEDLQRIVAQRSDLSVSGEIFEDGEACWRRIQETTASAREIFVVYTTPVEDDWRDAKRNRLATLESLRRGVTVRTIVRDGMLDDPDEAALIRELHAAGNLHRTIGEQVQQMLIIDRAAAFLQLAPGRRASGAMLITSPGIVAALVDLFERTWSTGGHITEPEGLERLTRREREVLALMADGLSNTAVADALYITAAAVAKHIANIFAKLDLAPAKDSHRRVQAVLAYRDRHSPRNDPLAVRPSTKDRKSAASVSSDSRSVSNQVTAGSPRLPQSR